MRADRRGQERWQMLNGFSLFISWLYMYVRSPWFALYHWILVWGTPSHGNHPTSHSQRTHLQYSVVEQALHLPRPICVVECSFTTLARSPAAPTVYCPLHREGECRVSATSHLQVEQGGNGLVKSGQQQAKMQKEETTNPLNSDTELQPGTRQAAHGFSREHRAEGRSTLVERAREVSPGLQPGLAARGISKLSSKVAILRVGGTALGETLPKYSAS